MSAKNRKKKERQRRRRLKGRETVKSNGDVNQYHKLHKLEHASIEHPLSEWDLLTERAKNGEISEEDRATVAVEESMLACLNTFNESLIGKNLDAYNTHLGHVLGKEQAIAGSMVLFHTGRNHTHEFVPVVIKVCVGEIQEVEEHIDFLTSGEWRKMLDPKPAADISIFKDQEQERPMLFRAPKSIGLR